jgi:hypothetical protein
MNLPKTRLSTFLTHLGASALVASFVIVLVFFVWYPAPLQDAQGVTKIFLLLLGIDLSIGPLLTLVTYKPTQGFFKCDLPIIVALQVIALLYGMHTVFQARPAFIVFNRNNFTVVRTVDLDSNSLNVAQKNNNAAAVASWFSPRWIATIPPTDASRLNEVFFSAQDWNQLAESFAPLEQGKAQVLAKARSLQELRTTYQNNTDILRELNSWQSTVKWLPLMALTKNMIVLVNAESAEIISILDINPFPDNKAASSK